MSTNKYFEEIGAWPYGSGHARTYVWGFILSLILTLVSYFVAMDHVASRDILICIVFVLAIVQFAIQLVCFLHLGRETVSRERLIVLSCALLIVVILVSGSVWIMFSLDQRMTPSADQMESYMNSQQGI